MGRALATSFIYAEPFTHFKLAISETSIFIDVLKVLQSIPNKFSRCAHSSIHFR